MAIYDLVDFSDVISYVMDELKQDSNDEVAENRVRRSINAVYLNKVVPAKRWPWLYGNTAVRQSAYYADGTVTVTPDSTTITFSTAPAASKTNHLFAVDSHNEIYRITAHTAGATTATIEAAYTGSAVSAGTFKIWSDTIAMPTNLKETIEVWHEHMQDPLEPLGLQDFRRRTAENPKVEGRPALYTTYDFEDPTTGTAETESDRYRVLKVFPSICQYSTTIHVDYIKQATALELDADEPLMPIEDRIVLAYGALEMEWKRARNTEASEQSRRDFQEKLASMMGKIEDAIDKPQFIPSSNYVSRKRGPRIKSSVYRTGLSGGSSYTSPTYIRNATIEGGNVTANITVASGITIDGRDISADGTLIDAATAHIIDTTDAHAASAITNSPTGNLSATTVQGALNELQGDIDGITTLADGKIYVGNASNVATEVTPSGDVTITNAGVTAIAAGVIVNADINGSAAIAYSKLSLTGGIVNADISGSAAIAYSKLNLTGTIVNADISASAAIARSKIAGESVTASKDADYTVTTADDVVRYAPTANRTCTLYTAVGNSGRKVIIKKTDSSTNYVLIEGDGSETIDGATNRKLATEGESLTLISDGANWMVVAHEYKKSWQSFTPTGSATTNATYTGFWRRVGDSAEVNIKIAWAGAPNAFAALTVNLPSGFTIDTAKVANTTTFGQSFLGIGSYTDTGTANYQVAIGYDSTTAVKLLVLTASGSYALESTIDSTSPFAPGNTDYATATFVVPIANWEG